MTDVARAVAVATLLMAASSRSRLYGATHRLTQDTVDELLAALQPLLAEERQLRLAVSGEELLTEDSRLDPTNGSVAALVQRFTDKGIGLLELHRGIQRDELATFCEQLGDPRPGVIPSQSHLLVGAAEIKGVGDAKAAIARGGGISEEALLMRSLEHYVREHHEVRLRDAREIVLGLLAHLAHGENVFFNLADVHRHDLATYQHSCNVATLAMSFGLALGLDGEGSFELGAAALLHDLGKTFVPLEILGKPGPLDAAEWEVVRRHPAMGARLLMRQRDVPRMAVVVAFEHHMHWKGDGGYPRTGFQPALHSQLVGMVDAFEAIVAKRSYRRPMESLQALSLLREERGRAFAPRMFDEFERFMKRQIESAEASQTDAGSSPASSVAN